jgi:hypothetical protein
MTVTASITASLSLSEREAEAFRAVGRESGSYTDWQGTEAGPLCGLRHHGLVASMLGFWRLTTFGRQAYEQIFRQKAA